MFFQCPRIYPINMLEDRQIQYNPIVLLKQSDKLRASFPRTRRQIGSRHPATFHSLAGYSNTQSEGKLQFILADKI